MLHNRLKVAILGRPNVGKSTLFNQLTGSRKAVVKDEPGVTRDVHRGKSEWCGITFEIFDTAGVSGKSKSEKAWTNEARQKALEAAKMADKIVLVLDGKFGLNPEDRDLAKFAKQLRKPVLTVINKLDQPHEHDIQMSEFYELGLESLVAASFEHKFGLAAILDWIIEGQSIDNKQIEDDQMRLAVVGKPNAGKSTLVNCLLGGNHVVVSPIAGTTVDSVEIQFERDGINYLLIDTAGLRRGARRNSTVEMISAFKAEESVAEADILLLTVDGVIGPTHQDARLVEMALEHHKTVILVINKIDIAEKRIKHFREELREKIEDIFHFYIDIPVVFISAKTGRGIAELFKEIEKVWKQLNKRIATRDLNDFFFQVIRQAPSPSFHGHDIKFFYVTQTRQKPPSFMAFVNEPRGITNAYKRFIVGKMKSHYGLKGIPIRIYTKKRRAGEMSVASGRGGPEDEKP